MAAGCAFVMPSIVGEALTRFGTEEQKRKYLEPMLAGKLVSAEALTEPRGGSDFFGASSVAHEEGDHLILRGQKRFVVGAEGADFFLVYARTNHDEAAHPYNRLSAMIVDRCDQVKVNYRYGLMGTRGGGTGRIVFRDVRVPKENLIGPLHGRSGSPRPLPARARCARRSTSPCATRTRGRPSERRSANSRR
jgi:alkylation response protein AidB-like acyl-CoA dehydrogenase